MKKSKLLVIFPLILLTTSCSNNGDFKSPTLPQEEKYRTYYEIFPGTYYDSDGDGYGDLNGITEKLSYIQDLGFNGIWLTPIHESPSYHGYDVDNYLSINPNLGTMDDYRNLVKEAHNKGINVILDLVLNHTSTSNPWFVEGAKAFKEGKGGKYSDYYNFSLTSDSVHPYISNGVYYESGFGGGSMPDLNLDSENVKNEIKEIIRFYMEDIGIDGFRLDAVPWYFKGNDEKNIKFLSRLNAVTKSYNENAYIVAEAWESAGFITRYYESGIDSFFAYDTDCLGKDISSAIVTGRGHNYTDKMSFLVEQAGNHIPAPFITNHDNPRAANILQARNNDKYLKFGQGLMQMMSGTTFTYYGDEIGMIGVNPPDENVRTAMYWGEEEGTCNNPSGATADEKIYPSVKEQLGDQNSILNYYKKANYIRNSYESIRKGSVEKIDTGDNELQVIKKTYNEETTHLIINFGVENKTYDLSTLNLDSNGYESLLVDINEDKVSIEGNKITIPPCGIVIMNNK